MPGVTLEGFCGSSHRSASIAESLNRTVNYYLETTNQPANSKSQAALYQRGGLAQFGALPVGAPFNHPVRGMMQFDGNAHLDGAIYGVSGPTFWTADSTGTQTAIPVTQQSFGGVAQGTDIVVVFNTADLTTGMTVLGTGTNGAILADSLNAGGTNYSVNDTGTISGNTGTDPATYRVTSIANEGAITDSIEWNIGLGNPTGYAVNDTGTVLGTSGTPATYIITAVNIVGYVQGYTLTSAGTGYSVSPPGTGQGTVTGGAQPGVGLGFEIQISSVVTQGPITAYTLTSPGSGYVTTTGAATATGGTQPGVGTGFTIDITSVQGPITIIAITPDTFIQLSASITALGPVTFIATGGTQPPMADDGKPVQIVANAATVGQIFIASAGEGYCLSGGVLTHIVNDGQNFLGARGLTFIDGYFVVLNVTFNNQQFQISAINDGMTWSALDIAILLGQADPIQATIVNIEYLYFLGSRRGQIWYNSGASLFPFTIESGAFLEVGTVAPASVCQGSTSGIIYFLSQDARGANVAMRVQGLASQRISDHDVEAEWAKYSITTDVICYAMTWNGHAVVRYIFPTATMSRNPQVGFGWEYDDTESKKVGYAVWNELNFTDGNGNQFAPVERAYCYAFGKHLIGSGGTDGRPGTLYEINQATYSDCIDFPITRDRYFRLPFNGGLRTIIDRIEFFVQTGVGNPFLANVVLSLSQDGGNTYGPDITISMGQVGQYLTRVLSSRMGYYVDGAIRLRCTDAVYSVLVGAQFYARPLAR